MRCACRARPAPRRSSTSRRCSAVRAPCCPRCCTVSSPRPKRPSPRSSLTCSKAVWRDLAAGSRHMIIGRVLAWQLGAEVGDEAHRDGAGRECFPAGGGRYCRHSSWPASSRLACRITMVHSRYVALEDAADSRATPVAAGVCACDSTTSCWPRGRCGAARGAGRRQVTVTRLDAGSRGVFPRDPHRKDDDEPDPAAGRRRRGVQHRRGAGHGREREALGHRDSAHARSRRAWRRRACSSRRGSSSAPWARCSASLLGLLVAYNVRHHRTGARAACSAFTSWIPAVYYITAIPSESAPARSRDRRDRVRADRAGDDLPGDARRGDRTGRSAAVRMMRRHLTNCGSAGAICARPAIIFCPFISLISMTGVAIGVAVLIVVLSVMNGFERGAAEPHPEPDVARDITAFGAGLPDWPAHAGARPRSARRRRRAPFVEGEALLIADRKAARRVPRSCAASLPEL